MTVFYNLKTMPYVNANYANFA
uniref:Uncharacterized protein n=1 Tax=Rhizophora mucronata TaxID=61149 RepID=A0A2P2PIQ0_RHIMU